MHDGVNVDAGFVRASLPLLVYAPFVRIRGTDRDGQPRCRIQPSLALPLVIGNQLTRHRSPRPVNILNSLAHRHPRK